MAFRVPGRKMLTTKGFSATMQNLNPRDRSGVLTAVIPGAGLLFRNFNQVTIIEANGK